METHDWNAEELRRHGAAAMEWVAHYLENIRDFPVLPRMKPGDLVDALPREAPLEGEPVEAIFADFEAKILPAVNHWNHPRFHAYFSVSASGPGIVGELLSAALNVNGMLWMSCPAAVELELVVMGWLRQWLGLPEAFFGMIHDTASTSTLHAIGAARAAADPALREEGASPGLVLYTSEHAHSSVEKAAMALGIGRKNVRKIPVDESWRMRPDLLEKAVREDRQAGRRPFCVVSTVGTTSVASVDPVAEIQEVAGREGLWHHIDAAYGGAAAMLEENRWMLAGAERADSLVMNPHKWLFTPIDCSAFFCRRPEMLREAFSLTPPYLASKEDPRAVHLMDYRIALGSRFRALKLWFVMRHFGYRRVCAIIRQHIAWAKELAAEMAAHPKLEVAAPVLMSLVCFRHREGDEATRRLMQRVNESGVAFLSGNVLGGRQVARIAIGNIRTAREDVRTTWEAVRRAAEEA
ncbi:MAG: pyridoxal-dependent decarboxylase [Bryobacteraceae bacterium]|nr:pyridoxal-dependent decarboxylase [Bryobacteraceae bacterium]